MLGIIGAMDEEVARLKEQLSDVQVETRAAMDFYKGRLDGIHCGPRPTSCPDQLARALKQYQEQ